MLTRPGGSRPIPRPRPQQARPRSRPQLTRPRRRPRPQKVGLKTRLRPRPKLETFFKEINNFTF